jgi:hypothetical protein
MKVQYFLPFWLCLTLNRIILTMNFFLHLEARFTYTSNFALASKSKQPLEKKIMGGGVKLSTHPKTEDPPLVNTTCTFATLPDCNLKISNQNPINIIPRIFNALPARIKSIDCNKEFKKSVNLFVK